MAETLREHVEAVLGRAIDAGIRRDNESLMLLWNAVLGATAAGVYRPDALAVLDRTATPTPTTPRCSANPEWPCRPEACETGPDECPTHPDGPATTRDRDHCWKCGGTVLASDFAPDEPVICLECADPSPEAKPPTPDPDALADGACGYCGKAVRNPTEGIIGCSRGIGVACAFDSDNAIQRMQPAGAEAKPPAAVLTDIEWDAHDAPFLFSEAMEYGYGTEAKPLATTREPDADDFGRVKPSEPWPRR